MESQRALAAYLTTRFETRRIKAERDRASANAMEELAKQAQELHLGYE